MAPGYLRPSESQLPHALWSARFLLCSLSHCSCQSNTGTIVGISAEGLVRFLKAYFGYKSSLVVGPFTMSLISGDLLFKNYLMRKRGFYTSLRYFLSYCESLRTVLNGNLIVIRQVFQVFTSARHSITNVSSSILRNGCHVTVSSYPI